MELDEKTIDAFWTKDFNGKPQFFIINEAIISKLCILGEEVEPCFEGAQIKVQFSFEEGFENKLFSLMKKIIHEGGAPMFTTYAVEIGDSLWSALYDYLIAHFPEEDCEYCSNYRIEGIYEEESQKFAILRNSTTGQYFRMNFSISEEEGYLFSEELISVEKAFVPAEEPQFAADKYDEFVQNYAASKKEPEKEEEEKEDEEICEKCGKPVSECECEDEEEEEEKKKTYSLEEIPEYVALNDSYSALQADYEALNNQMATLNSSLATLEAEKSDLEAQIASLVEFKNEIERKEKKAMINETFYMVADEDKKEILENIDTYSLDDIEAKLSVICFRKQIPFSQEETPAVAQPVTYGLASIDQEDSSIPAWVKAVLETQKNL